MFLVGAVAIIGIETPEGTAFGLILLTLGFYLTVKGVTSLPHFITGAIFLSVGLWLATLGYLAIWDMAFNHAGASTYTLPAGLGTYPSYFAGDLAGVMLILGLVLAVMGGYVLGKGPR